jgi:hypothetical protein
MVSALSFNDILGGFEIGNVFQPTAKILVTNIGISASWWNQC